MPFGDQTGPAGTGPMTGRAAGFCAGYPTPGYANPVGGRGFGGRGGGLRGRGGGRGRRNRFYATGLTGYQRAATGFGAFGAAPADSYGPPTASTEQQLDMLKGQARYFQDALDGIRKRMEEIEHDDAKAEQK